MKMESKQKLSSFAVSGVLAFGIALLIVFGTLVAITQRDSPGPLILVITLVTLALGVAVFGLKYVEQSGCRFLGDELLVGHPFGFLHIDYQSVIRVERVARMNGQKTEKVRIIFKHLGRNKRLCLTPECPTLLVSQLLTHCPNLTLNRMRKMKRDARFRAIA